MNDEVARARRRADRGLRPPCPEAYAAAVRNERRGLHALHLDELGEGLMLLAPNHAARLLLVATRRVRMRAAGGPGSGWFAENGHVPAGGANAGAIAAINKAMTLMPAYKNYSKVFSGANAKSSADAHHEAIVSHLVASGYKVVARDEATTSLSHEKPPAVDVHTGGYEGGADFGKHQVRLGRSAFRAAGDAPGHEFHGNQWTEGQGRDENGLNRGTGQRAETGGGWHESPTSERPYEGVKVDRGSDWKGTDPDHEVIRDGGLWGSSHGASRSITGSAAKQMGIEGYRDNGNDSAEKVADRFLTAIASDQVGAPDVLHHSFENVTHTEFTPGDTVRLPLTATSGRVGTYGIRLDADSQRGQPVVFEFEKGTQMAGYSRWKPADAKEFGEVWSEALVAGGFKVKSVREAYMGSQHFNQFYAKPQNEGKTIQIYGKVVRLEQTESFHPKEGWSKRG